MTIDRSRRRPRVVSTVALTALTILAATASYSSSASATPSAVTSVVGSVSSAKPTVVLIHGAFADASGWAGTITRLQARGYPVLAPANPLRGVATDAAYVASILATIPGPVVLVGHSYGGEVITNAAVGHPNVKALVYIAAFAPDQGETSGQLSTMFPGSQLTPENLVFRPFPISATQNGVDAYINPTVFRAVFCADLPKATAAVMAASQRPGALSTLSEPSGTPAWKTIPSWYLVAGQDQAIPPASERFMAKRMGAHTVEIASSHVAMISHPGAVTDMIIDAAQTTK